nr:hypothetical protein [Mycobacterium leprae]
MAELAKAGYGKLTTKGVVAQAHTGKVVLYHR